MQCAEPNVASDPAKEPTTIVVFRKYADGDVVALLPEIPHDAYFGRSRPPISVDADHPFQLMATTRFSRCRPLISRQADHLFR
jgi:hypothetical protein